MHEVSTSRKAAISENNATIEDLKSAQDDVLPAAQGKMALVSMKVIGKLHVAGIFDINFF